MPEDGNDRLIIYNGLKTIQYFPGIWHGVMVLRLLVRHHKIKNISEKLINIDFNYILAIVETRHCLVSTLFLPLPITDYRLLITDYRLLITDY